MKLYFVDIETYKPTEDGMYEEILDTNYFILGGIINPDGTRHKFYNAESMCDYIYEILEENKNVGLFAHNHEFDFYGYFKNNIKKEINNEKLNIIRGNPLLGIYNNHNYFLDTMAFFPHMSVESLGELIGFPKLERKPKIKYADELEEYMFRDIEILKKAIEMLLELLNELDYKPRKLITLGSIGVKLLMKEIRNSGKAGYYMRRGEIIKNKDNIKFLREASKGGRVQAFQIGKWSNCSLLDINSAYWKAMADMPFPDLLKETRYSKETINYLGYETILSKTGVINCIIQTSGKGIGILPIRTNIMDKKNYKLEFPNNGEELEGFWTTYEINEAIKRGYKLKEIHEAIVYQWDMKESVLSTFINKLWDLRKKYMNDPFKNKIIKLIGNSLYGKFLQKSKKKQIKWVHRVEIDKYIAEGWDIESGGQEYCISKKEEEYIPPHLSIIIGALTTAYTRIQLVKILEKIPEEDILYCDTDSIMFKGNHKNKFKIGTNLGEFKIEKENEIGAVRGEKMYYIGDDVKLSGVRKEFRTKELIENGGEIEQMEMFGLGSAIKTGAFEKLGEFNKKVKRIE